MAFAVSNSSNSSTIPGFNIDQIRQSAISTVSQRAARNTYSRPIRRLDDGDFSFTAGKLTILNMWHGFFIYDDRLDQLNQLDDLDPKVLAETIDQEDLYDEYKKSISSNEEFCVDDVVNHRYKEYCDKMFMIMEALNNELHRINPKEFPEDWISVETYYHDSFRPRPDDFIAYDAVTYEFIKNYDDSVEGACLALTGRLKTNFPKRFINKSVDILYKALEKSGLARKKDISYCALMSFYDNDGFSLSRDMRIFRIHSIYPPGRELDCSGMKKKSLINMCLE